MSMQCFFKKIYGLNLCCNHMDNDTYKWYIWKFNQIIKQVIYGSNFSLNLLFFCQLAWAINWNLKIDLKIWSNNGYWNFNKQINLPLFLYYTYLAIYVPEKNVGISVFYIYFFSICFAPKWFLTRNFCFKNVNLTNFVIYITHDSN